MRRGTHRWSRANITYTHGVPHLAVIPLFKRLDTRQKSTYKHKREKLLTLKYSYVEIVLEIPEIGFTLFFVCSILGLVYCCNMISFQSMSKKCLHLTIFIFLKIDIQI